MRLLHGLATALLGAGLGVQVFLSFLVAPAAFRVVDRPVAARVMEGVFPGYYGFGLTTITMALALALLLAFRESAPLRWATVGLLVLTLVGTVYAGHVLLPQARRGSPPRPGGASRRPRPPRVLAASPAGRGGQHRSLLHRGHRPGSPPWSRRRRPHRAGAAGLNISSSLGESRVQPTAEII